MNICGESAYLYRTKNQDGQIVDFVLPEKRDVATARALFKKINQISGPAAGDNHA
ncbi:DDE-type integrase/transposase/recombinase [Paraburkholderia adhaesiva]|uniref:DDE-type integrase/transposase/recombinase n=1 Tax=Paraburkholderia adhaesiva TaxID=2883244 RepID=UPI0027E49871|nr:DDE-type integrase/transposase/recombinase [Paraburkholderia adhaesiva]